VSCGPEGEVGVWWGGERGLGVKGRGGGGGEEERGKRDGMELDRIVLIILWWVVVGRWYMWKATRRCGSTMMPRGRSSLR